VLKLDNFAFSKAKNIRCQSIMAQQDFLSPSASFLHQCVFQSFVIHTLLQCCLSYCFFLPFLKETKLLCAAPERGLL